MDYGIQISRAVSVVADAGRQANALAEYIAERLIAEPRLAGCQELDWSGADDRCSTDGWVELEHVFNLRLKRPGKRKFGDERIAVNVSFSGECLSGHDEAAALVYVLYANDGDWDFRSEVPPVHLEEVQRADSGYRCLAGSLWLHEDDDGTRYWMYALPLAALGDTQDVDRNVVQPARALLRLTGNGELAESSVAEALTGATHLVRFDR